MVRNTLLPGWGARLSPVSSSVSHWAETILPFSLRSRACCPGVPWRYSSKAASAPETPTVSFML